MRNTFPYCKTKPGVIVGVFLTGKSELLRYTDAFSSGIKQVKKRKEYLSVIYLSPIRSWRGSAMLSSMNEYQTMTEFGPEKGVTQENDVLLNDSVLSLSSTSLLFVHGGDP
jgi:hypothetical protein